MSEEREIVLTVSEHDVYEAIRRLTRENNVPSISQVKRLVNKSAGVLSAFVSTLRSKGALEPANGDGGLRIARGVNVVARNAPSGRRPKGRLEPPAEAVTLKPIKRLPTLPELPEMVGSARRLLIQLAEWHERQARGYRNTLASVDGLGEQTVSHVQELASFGKGGAS